MEDFSKRLKKLRLEKGLLQRELAELLNLTRPAITYYELGKRFPDQEILKKIADFFDVSIDYLVGRVNHKNPALSETKEEYLVQTEHYDPISDLPPEAQRLFKDFKEFILAKYGKNT